MSEEELGCVYCGALLEWGQCPNCEEGGMRRRLNKGEQTEDEK